jgi:cell division inhibitor SepF
MGMASLWHKTLVYFGLADEDDDYYEDEEMPVQQPDVESTYRQRANVRRIEPTSKRRSSGDFDDIFSDDDYRPSSRQSAMSSTRSQPPVRAVPASQEQQQPVRVHLVVPKNFNDAQIIADKFKGDVPVILNLQQSETELSKRLIDFASGLTYALDGGMQRVADKVFLLTPKNVEVSAEERQRLLEKGFFNQY